MNESHLLELVKVALVETDREWTDDKVAGHIARVVTNHDKWETVATALQSASILVLFDPRLDLVTMPAAHRAKPSIGIRLGYTLSPPIPDLELTSSGISATLAFGATRYMCIVPWDAVFAIQNERREMMAIWQASVPSELRAPQPADEVKRPKLGLVP